MEKTSLVNLVNQFHQTSLNIIDDMDDNIWPQDVLKVLNYLIDEMTAISEQVNLQCLKYCTDKDSGPNSQYKPVVNEEDDEIMVDHHTEGFDSLTAAIILAIDSSTETSTNSTDQLTSPEREPVENHRKKCKVSVNRFDANKTRIKPCSVALKRFSMSNILKIHKLELIGVNCHSIKQLSEDKENKNSSMKLRRQKNIKTIKVDRKSTRRCMSQDSEHLSDGCCIQ